MKKVDQQGPIIRTMKRAIYFSNSIKNLTLISARISIMSFPLKIALFRMPDIGRPVKSFDLVGSFPIWTLFPDLLI